MSTESNQIDLKSLQSRINDIKKEGEEITDFTYDFLHCLMFRHDLADCLPPDFELEDVPDHIVESLRNGNVPEKEQLLMISPDAQNFMCFELVWVCGMGALAAYGADEDGDEEEGIPSTFDVILAMRDVSPAHDMASYIIAALTLLMCQVPSEDMIARLTHDFNDDHEQLQQNMDNFVELASAIITRYREDMMYYGKPKELD
jgi:SHS2 domain-containing protein